jgi:hypothetical protein
MTDYTRRDWLQNVGVSVTGFVPYATSGRTDDTQEPNVQARDVIVPETVVPDRFTPYSERGTGRFFDILTDKAPELTDVDFAGNGYWDGDTQEDPHWVVSSIALVANDTLPRGTVEAAARKSYDEYVSEYDAETEPRIDFEQSRVRSGRSTEFQVDMVQTSMFDDASEADPIFSDLMRLQFLDNVLLGTVVFGPRSKPPELTALLEEFATQQYSNYRAHGANR